MNTFWGYQAFWKSMGISVVRTALSLVFTLTLTVLSAYPLSKSPKKFYGRSIFAWYFFIPMLINGGLIPTYMIISRLGLIGSLWALILPSAVTRVLCDAAAELFPWSAGGAGRGGPAGWGGGSGRYYSVCSCRWRHPPWQRLPLIAAWRSGTNGLTVLYI